MPKPSVKTNRTFLCTILHLPMAESQGFEPWVPCGTTVFKTVAFVHSANSPYNIYFVAILIASAFNC